MTKKEATIGIGEIVFVRIPVHQGRHTRADKVEDELYTVVEEVNVIPVYNIKVQQPLENITSNSFTLSEPYGERGDVK